MATIWLIEDNVAFRDAMQFALNLYPGRYTWRAFESCEKAISNFEEESKPDVILLDVDLPGGMDGIEGIQHFKKLAPDAVQLVLTVFEDDDKVFRAICSGASGYLLKSETFSEIVAAIDQALDGRAPMSPEIARRVLSMFSRMAPEKKDYGLTEREQAVLELMVQGLSKKIIADRLGISRHTVGNFVRFIYKKLHVHCQTAAVSLALRDGIVKHDSAN